MNVLVLFALIPFPNHIRLEQLLVTLSRGTKNATSPSIIRFCRRNDSHLTIDRELTKLLPLIVFRGEKECLVSRFLTEDDGFNDQGEPCGEPRGVWAEIAVFGGEGAEADTVRWLHETGTRDNDRSCLGGI